jgi:hypothetical protein
MLLSAKASRNLGLTPRISFPGRAGVALPVSVAAAPGRGWSRRPSTNWRAAGARSSMPSTNGRRRRFELHPGEDLFDGATFEMLLERVAPSPAPAIAYDPSHFLLQQLDYLEFIDLYHERIKVMHVKDAEFRPSGKQGVYSGYQPWADRAGRFRSLGDGQIDFKAIFSKFAQYGFKGWAVLEWECCLKHPEQGAREGAPFIRDHIIQVTDKAFDDFAATATKGLMRPFDRGVFDFRRTADSDEVGDRVCAVGLVPVFQRLQRGRHRHQLAWRCGCRSAAAPRRWRPALAARFHETVVIKTSARHAARLPHRAPAGYNVGFVSIPRRRISSIPPADLHCPPAERLQESARNQIGFFRPLIPKPAFTVCWSARPGAHDCHHCLRSC